MKKMTFFTLILLVLSTISLQTAFAQVTLEGHRREVNSVSFSPDGTTLASAGDGLSDGGVQLWDVATHTNIATLQHRGGVESVSFSPDGTLLASAGDSFLMVGCSCGMWRHTQISPHFGIGVRSILCRFRRMGQPSLLGRMMAR